MAVTVRLFAMLREHAGTAAVEIPYREDLTAGQAMSAAAAHTGLVDLLGAMPVAIAVNRSYASPTTALHDGDEVALIPPVSGGAAPHVRVHDGALSLDRLVQMVRDPRAGAIVTFQGEPREVDRLDYEAYTEMAEEQIRLILEQVLQRDGVVAVAAEHRIGPVPVGESCVIVAVSSAHRAQAFAAAQEVMDRIKADAPIWKREVTGARRDWVLGAGRVDT